MSWWPDVNFAGSASIGAQFSAGAFQQGGWGMTLVVTVAIFIFSMISFAAYVSLMSIVYWAQQQQHRGHVGDAAIHQTPFRASTRFSSLTWTSTPNQKEDKKKKSKLTSPPSQLFVLPEASMLVHLFTGSEALTRLFELAQLTVGLTALVLKEAGAVDMAYTFVRASPEAALMLQDSFIWTIVSTPTGMSAISFGVMALCVSLPLAAHTRLVRVADSLMIAAQLLLVYFLVTQAVAEWGRQGPKPTFGATAAQLPDDADHLSLLFPLPKRFFFAFVAVVALYLPHLGTPLLLRAPPSNLPSLPRRALHQLAASTSGLTYYLLLGLAYDVALPVGRTTPRIAVLNFVDYRVWLPNAELYSWVVVVFALIPFIHVVSVARGLLEMVLNIALRVTSSPPIHPAQRRNLLLMLAAVTSWMSIHFRPVYSLVLGSCLVHLTYLALFAVVWRRRWAEPRKANKRISLLATQLAALPEPAKAGVLWAPTSPSSLPWRSCLVALTFWAVATIYWVGVFL